jgi:pSer/pThr/pTyr-binding forkhead associated (FHA) protein
MTAHANANIPASSWLELPDGRTFWLKASCSVGRQPDNELILESLTLSRRHALLTAEGDGYTVSDLHSRNGTFLNGSAITRPVPLRDCDELRFGDVIVRFRCTRQLAPTALADDAAATRRFDHVRERPCWLLLVDVVGFASLSEKLGSEAAHHRLQEWITGLRPLIETHEGHINGYLGDAIFAYWLADVALPGSLRSPSKPSRNCVLRPRCRFVSSPTTAARFLPTATAAKNSPATTSTSSSAAKRSPSRSAALRCSAKARCAHSDSKAAAPWSANPPSKA